MTAITLYIVDNLNPANPLESVIVRVYNQAGDTFVTQLTSGSAGTITTDIPDATYWVRFYKKGYSFASKLLIAVDTNETNEWIVEGDDLTTLPPSGADGICRASGYIIDAQGAPSHLPIITFMLPKNTRIMGRNIIGTEKVTTQPNTDGYVEVELMQDAIYHATMASISDDVISVKLPKQQACNITDLLYPMGKLLSNLPSTTTITVGEDTDIAVSFGSSSGITLPDSDLGLTAIDLFTADTSSKDLTVKIEQSKLVLNAAESGTYTVLLYGKCKNRYSIEDPTLLGTITVTANDP